MRFYKSIIFGSLLLAGCTISSCDNEENYQNVTPEINISGEERIVTFEVDDAFTGNDETVTRSTLDEEQTVYKDLDFEAVIERAEPVKTRAEQPLEKLNNIAVTVITYNSQSGKVTSIQRATANKGQLSIKLPDSDAATAVLYSYRTGEYPYVPYSVGENIDNNKNTPEAARDLLYASVSIPAGSATIPKVSFKHLFAKIKVKIVTAAAPPMQLMSMFSGKLTSPHTTGRVYLKDGKVVADGIQQVYSINSDNNTNTGAEVSSNEVDIIPFSEEVLTFKLESAVVEYGAPYGTYNIPFNTTIKSGHRYTIKITLYPPTIQYYEWDADDAYFKGNNTRYHEGATAYSSCQWAAPARDFSFAFASNTYKSFGWPYRAYPSGTSVEAVKNGTAKLAIYNTGFWVRKASEWTIESSSGKGNTWPSDKMETEGGKRKFIPAAGYILAGKFSGVGEEAYYWSKDATSDKEKAIIMYMNKSETGSERMRRDMAAPVIAKTLLDPYNDHP